MRAPPPPPCCPGSSANEQTIRGLPSSPVRVAPPRQRLARGAHAPANLSATDSAVLLPSNHTQRGERGWAHVSGCPPVQYSDTLSLPPSLPCPQFLSLLFSSLLSLSQSHSPNPPRPERARAFPPSPPATSSRRRCARLPPEGGAGGWSP